MNFEILDWVVLSLTTLLVGIGKIGFSGLSLITVSIYASYFGKSSVGVLLPLLILADCVVYPAMRKHGSWKEALRLLPPALLGIAVGLVLLNKMPDAWAKVVIAWMIILMLLVILWKRIKPESKMYYTRGFALSAAIGGGVSTTLANAAGPVINIYLLAQNFPKMQLVGISARFFLLVNLIKLPLLGGVDLVTWESLLLNLKLAPCVVIGVFMGKWLLNKVPQRHFNFLIILFALIAAGRLLF